MELIKKIEALEISDIQDLKKVVVTIHWRIKLVDGQHSAETYNVAQVEPPTKDKFIVYEELTEEEVFSWLNLDLDAIKAKLSTDIDLQKTPLVRTIVNPFVK